MKFTIFLTISIFSYVSTLQISFEGYHAYAISVDEKNVKLVRTIEDAFKGSFFVTQVESTLDYALVVIPPTEVLNFEKFTASHGLQAILFSENVQELLDEEIGTRRNLRRSRGESNLDWTFYWTLSEYYEWMENLAEKYPQQISLIEFGKSYEGRNMTGIKLNIGGGRKKAIIIEGMFHAREWISGATITWILNELLTSPNPEVQKIAESYEWHIFPVMNPDGYEYSWTTDRFQRKNRRVFDKSLNTTCVGVDLNRNFDDHFEVVNSHCEAVYGGPKPFSEPETFYFAKYLTNLKTKIFAYYSIHAFSELIMTPYGWTTQNPPDYDFLMRLAEVGQKAIKNLYGTQYKIGQISRILYKAPGNSLDWAYSKLKPNYALVYEVRPNVRNQHNFVLPPQQIIPNSEEVYAAIIAQIKEAESILGVADQVVKV